jgi:hypothetical protein
LLFFFLHLQVFLIIFFHRFHPSKLDFLMIKPFGWI